jgi:hypothetical protein
MGLIWAGWLAGGSMVWSGVMRRRDELAMAAQSKVQVLWKVQVQAASVSFCGGIPRGEV